MADTKLSDLSAATAIAGTDLLYAVQTPGVGGVKATVSQLGTVLAPLAGATFTGAVAVNGASFSLTGNISAAAWTTNGIRYKNVSATLTDTSSSGTVAAAYTNVFGGNTIAASNATTFTDYATTYIAGPTAGTNVTFTNSWATIFGQRIKATGYAISAITTESGTTRTLAASDNGTVIYCTSSSAVTITTATSLGAGFSCMVIQGGAGQVTIAQGTSTTLVGYGAMYKTAGQYALINIICPVADMFYVSGQTTA